MPEIKPDFLGRLAKHNEKHGVTATHSEMKKTARRVERLYNARPDLSLTVEDYFLDYTDETGETATDHVMNPEECTHHASIQQRMNRLVAA